jgi:ribonuclease-3
VQKVGKSAPVYQVTESGGSSHDPWFVVDVVVAGETLAQGRGRSKRLAERAAAAAALAQMTTSESSSKE